MCACSAAALCVLACLAAIVPTVVAQDETQEIPVAERKSARKKDAGPRAIAVLRMGDKGKSSLVPIAILIDGKFWDATVYKADPVPMALESGTVYEAERSGSSLGLFTVGSALHSNSPNAQAPWIGTGTWKPTGSEPPKPVLKANITPVGIDSDDAPPRLTHEPAKAAPASTTPASTPAPASSPTATTSSPSGSSDSDEPPRLNRPSSSSSQPPAGSAPSGQSSTADQSETKSGAPADSKSGQAKPEAKSNDTKSNVPASDSGADEANRPILRRGKPAESFADEDVPGYSKPGATGASSSSASDGKIVEAKAAQTDVKLIPAISDAAGPIPHPYTFEWIKGEEEDRSKQIIALAKQQVQAYVIAEDRATITPTHPQPSKHTAIKVKEPLLDNEQVIAYDLWNSNQPIMVLSAQAHLPPPSPGAPHSQVASGLQYSVTLVAYPDIYNNLHVLYSGVTDKFHLDLKPQLDLIDAVDADGDGRGELLFRETTDMGTGWVIYRATADKLYKIFDSLTPE